MDKWFFHSRNSYVSNKLFLVIIFNDSPIIVNDSDYSKFSDYMIVFYLPMCYRHS